MIDWIDKQFLDLNVLTIIIMIVFVTAMGKSNLNKQLTKQSEEFYKEIEEVKQEVWRARR
jgi:hypothetical protein